jgi:hypothetical protein
MKLSIALITIAFCVSHAIPVPEENIDLVNIPLNGDKVSPSMSLHHDDRAPLHNAVDMRNYALR